MPNHDRKLASVQLVSDVTPIPDADAIECVHVLGWTVVSPKGQFASGDKCIYLEIDSFLPIKDEFEFLRKSSYKKNNVVGEGFRLKTIKLRGQLSQGLLLGMDSLPGSPDDYEVGDNVTDILGIKLYEEEERLTNEGKRLGGLPSGVPKTDEYRVQSVPALIDEFAGVPYYISTKMDGTSVTMYVINGEFGVCSRTSRYADTADCGLWTYAHQHDVETGIRRAMEKLRYENVAVQGEFCGDGIQKNPLKLVHPEWYVFDVRIVDGGTSTRLGLDDLMSFCDEAGLAHVPVEETGEDLPYKTIDELLVRAEGEYESGVTKEGIVIRPLTPVYSEALGKALSMKVINNDYLLGKKGKKK